MHARSLFLCVIPDGFLRKRETVHSLIWSESHGLPKSVINKWFFRGNLRQQIQGAKSNMWRDVLKKVPVKQFLPFVLVAEYTQKKWYQVIIRYLYIFLNDNKISFTKTLSTKVQILVFMMGPCELQWWHFPLIEQVNYCKRKRNKIRSN